MGVKSELDTLYNTNILFDEPLSKHTYYKLGGNARIFAYPKTFKDLSELIFIAQNWGLKYFIIGNGSNVLASDSGFDGVCICTKFLDGINIENDKIRCCAGVVLSNLLSVLKDNCLSGLENLAGIPATVGGAVFMNAGANGGEISDKIISVQTLKDGRLKKYRQNECEFSYRNSIFQKNGEIILSVDFALEKRDYDECFNKLKESKRNRINMPTRNNCGCVFRNPLNAYAGELIERAGLKGYSIGGATVSKEHANFILTNINAKSMDVYNLINYVKNSVKDKFNVDLLEEVRFLGDF